MANEAAVITDRVLPTAPVRQWVLSLPRELSGLAATKPDVLTALGRIFAEEIARITRRIANVADSETGSLSFPQRFGGSLNLHLHFHNVAVDGVFEKQDDGVRLHETRPPEQEEIEEVARRVHDRAVRWLRSHDYLDDRPAEDRGNEPAEATPLDGFSRIALAGGTFLARPFAPREREDDKLERKPGRFAARHDGFDVHCGVRIAASKESKSRAATPILIEIRRPLGSRGARAARAPTIRLVCARSSSTRRALVQARERPPRGARRRPSCDASGRHDQIDTSFAARPPRSMTTRPSRACEGTVTSTSRLVSPPRASTSRAMGSAGREAPRNARERLAWRVSSSNRSQGPRLRCERPS
jgi:hypothetical protein